MATILFIISCYTIKFVAPPKQDIRLLTETENAPIKIQKRALFLIGGLIPLSNASTDEILAKYDLEAIKAKTEFDIIDLIISYFTGGLLVSKTVIIEGMPKK
jgi:hypothetical protein